MLMGAKVWRRATVYRDCKGDYTVVPNDPCLAKILSKKGLDHLHSLAPPLIHKGFKTSNFLVDENFIAKVSDAGVDPLLRGLEDPSSPLNGLHSDVYQDPEAHSLAQL
ncbi:Receptor-like protein kinase ANXUR1 [Hordeum vulgare]|nr:Receptor-like protein kinase ANXUR1 [Hordeum vulgare]